jgi:hypothetical protein
MCSPTPRLKEVVYTLSNHNQNVMAGLWKDLPYKVSKKLKENWVDSLFLLVPVIGTYECVPSRVSNSRTTLGTHAASAAAPREAAAAPRTLSCVCLQSLLRESPTLGDDAVR